MCIIWFVLGQIVYFCLKNIEIWFDLVEKPVENLNFCGKLIFWGYIVPETKNTEL